MDIAEAMKLVTTYGTSPLARMAAAEPRNMMSRQWPAWKQRRDAEEVKVADILRALGAFIEVNGDAARVTFAGVTASSTIGLTKALHNWRERAEKRAPRKKRW